MSSILSVDDIEIGQVVAFHSFFKTNGILPSSKPLSFRSPVGLIPAGAPMRVKGLSLPFVACEVIAPDGEEIGPAIVDIRRLRICLLSNEYINAVINPNRKKTEEHSFEDDVPF